METLNGPVAQTTAMSEEIVLTEKAAKQVFKLKSENNIPDDHGLRLGVKGGGCSGMTYVLAFDEKPKENDSRCPNVDPTRDSAKAGSLLFGSEVARARQLVVLGVGP